MSSEASVKRKIRCQECKTVQGVHKRSCSKSEKLTRIRILIILRQYDALSINDLDYYLPVKGLKLRSANSVLQKLRNKGYIKRDQGKFYLNHYLKDPVFFGNVCRSIDQGASVPPLSDFFGKGR